MAPTRRPASPPAPAPAAAAPPAPRPLPLQRALVRRRPRHRRRPLPLPILVRATAGPRVLVEVVAALGPRAPPAMSARRLARRRPPGPRRAPAEAAALDEDRVHHHGQRLLGRRRRLLRSRPLLPLLPSRRSVLGPHDEHRGLACGVRLPRRLGRPQTGRELWRKRRRKLGGRRCFVDAAEGSFVDRLGTARGGRRTGGSHDLVQPNHIMAGSERARGKIDHSLPVLSQLTENMAAVCSGKITAIHNGTRPINELAVSSGKLRQSLVSRSKFSLMFLVLIRCFVFFLILM